MDIAVLSDIHGNYTALNACIEEIKKRGINTYIFLGDYLGELAYPQRTMDSIYDLQEKVVRKPLSAAEIMEPENDCYFIRGNKEDYWLHYQNNGEHGWKENDSTTGSLLYTYTNLRKKDMAFFEQLPISRTIYFENLPGLTICHGSPDKVNEKLLANNENTFAVMEENVNSYILCGHSHIQAEITHDGRKVFNPGSVGVPLSSNGKSQFMILHGDQCLWNCEFVSIDYDIDKTIAELYESGLHVSAPYWCKTTVHLLKTGRITHGSVLAKAMKLCTEEVGECIWPYIPEKFWKQAVEEMIGS